MLYTKIYVVSIFLVKVLSETKIKILMVQEEKDILASIFAETLNTTEAAMENDIQITEKVATLVRRDEEATLNQVCKEFSSGISLLLDFTWTGWARGKALCKAAGIPYLKVSTIIHHFLQVVEDTIMTFHNATDIVFMFEHDTEVEQSIYYLVEFSRLRVLAINGLNSTSFKSVENMTPLPSFIVIIAETNKVNSIFAQAMEANLLKKNDQWNLVFTDFEYEKLNKGLLSVSVTKYTLKKTSCCPLAQLPQNCVCPESTKVTTAFIELLSKELGEIFGNLIKNKSYVEPLKVDCSTVDSKTQHAFAEKFYHNVTQMNKKQGIAYYSGTHEVYPELEFQISLTPSVASNAGSNSGGDTKIATWKTGSGIELAPGVVIKPGKRFFRIGTSKSIPWAYPSLNPGTSEPRHDNKGREIWEGYCMDFLRRLAKDMNFDYELIIADGFGTKASDGSWNGLIGDLYTGKIDIAVASLTMTSEREEAVDFVAPYFEQGGFTIVIRKPVRKTSLFKFMTVLRLEVWLSILASLSITGVMIWFLDKYSPYSGQNNRQLYPYPCRHFTLKESFWFALTSFTPQGGGEAPKALSGRALVAAYWLFVVLMLATFTANLAAFLTVERMQSPVQSLDQLARQSKINYTVVANHNAHKYFQNMKNAEDTLYRMWKEITLDSSSVQSQYRVWDYPIKEQYGHILQAIERAGLVPDSNAGIEKVLESEQGEFALIHDSPEVRYKITHNCNLTEVGDIFAEQPFSIAVQQGSQLNEELSRVILDLQKERFFESLQAKYWNASYKGVCHNSDDNEGLTLESLGGVFIATLFGLALAMITLCGEIIYHKKKKISNINTKTLRDGTHINILSRKEFGTSVLKHRSNIIKPNVTYISVFPHSPVWEAMSERNKK